ncbi:MAG: hypothetical protein AAFY25_11450 [Pseudomonadota bacterium]
MSWRGENQCCDRAPDAKEIPLTEAGPDYAKNAIPEVARCFWQTFAMPQTQAWLMALQLAKHRFRGQRGGAIGLEILATVQAMRHSRVSCFRFNNPACNSCAAFVSEHERQFMSVFRAVPNKPEGPARSHAMLLCEGNDTELLIERMTELVRVTYPKICALPVPSPEYLH